MQKIMPQVNEEVQGDQDQAEILGKMPINRNKVRKDVYETLGIEDMPWSIFQSLTSVFVLLILAAFCWSIALIFMTNPNEPPRPAAERAFFQPEAVAALPGQEGQDRRLTAFLGRPVESFPSETKASEADVAAWLLDLQPADRASALRTMGAMLRGSDSAWTAARGQGR